MLVQPADDLAFERIVNLPRRGVGDAALRAMHQAAREAGRPLSLAAAQLVQSGALKGRLRDSLGTFFRDLDGWRERLGRDGHVATAAAMLDESGYMAMWERDKSPDAPTRLENLKELVRALADFETMAGFLEHVSLVMENEEGGEQDRISLMTLHAAKGLEFDTVFLPGWEEGLFPSQRTMDESGIKGLEEERRLAYVGITRARKRAVLSHAANRRIYANWQSSIPSRFLDELPDDVVERHGSAAMQRAQYLGGASVFANGQPIMVRRPAKAIEAWEQPSRPVRDSGIPAGARVMHVKFGAGTVQAVDDDRLDIIFDHAGTKRVLDLFVELIGSGG